MHRDPTDQTTKQSSRRSFLAKGTAASLGAAAAITTIPQPSFGFHNSVDDSIKVGLVGCGGRGTGAIMNILEADSRTQITALADAFRDRVDITVESVKTAKPDRFKVKEDTIFTGVDCHEKIVQSDIDIVLLATPPHFRPAQMEAAVAAGKHVFCEKPVAVDVPGAMRVLEACKQAEAAGLSVVSGLCWRYSEGVNEVVRRVQEGAIGDIRAIECNYLTGTLWYRTPPKYVDWSSMENQLRNWLYYTWLSGDHTAEQHIHSIDKALWLMGDKPPIACHASGGRIARTAEKWGNVYDHFATAFEWEDGRKAFSHCRQMANCFSQTDDMVYGTEGIAKILSFEIQNGDGVWKYDDPKNKGGRMYVNEQRALVESIRNGAPINNGEYMVNSTLMANMARDAAYTGKRIKWEDYLKSEVVLGPESYENAAYQPDPVAIPGQNRKRKIWGQLKDPAKKNSKK